MNKFMISEQAEEEKKLLPEAERNDHFWAKTNASKGVNAKPGSVHIKPKTGNIIEVAESSHDTKTNLETKSEAKDDGSPVNAAKDDQSDTAQPKTSSMAKLSSELSKAHITPPSLLPPRFRSKQDDGKGFRRGRDRKRGKSKPLSPPAEPKEVPMKNAVMMLNEMFPPPGAAQYKVLSMKGSPNNPTFSMVCTIEGQEFEGTGRSKKEAKLAASQLALSTLFGKDFSDATPSTSFGCPKPLASLDTWLELEGKNPVSVLNELHPEATFTLVEATGPSHSPKFCIRATP